MSITILYPLTRAKIDIIELDASVSEQHTGQVEVTDHPVEAGADITDHARPKPETISIEGIVSNTPIRRKASTRLVTRDTQQFSTTTDRDSIAGTPGAAETAYTQLRSIKDTGRLVSVITKLRTYKDMLLTDLSVPVTAKTGDALQFSATFRQTRLVKSQTVDATITEPKAKPKSKKGKQTTKPADPSTERNTSWLLGGLQAVGVMQ